MKLGMMMPQEIVLTWTKTRNMLDKATAAPKKVEPKPVPKPKSLPSSESVETARLATVDLRMLLLGK